MYFVSFMRAFVGHEGTIFAASFTPDGEAIVSGCSNGELRFWDAKYGHDPALLELNDAHDLGVTTCAFSPGKCAKPGTKVRFQDPGVSFVGLRSALSIEVPLIWTR